MYVSIVLQYKTTKWLTRVTRAGATLNFYISYTIKGKYKCLILHVLVNRRAQKISERPILMSPLHGNLLDPYVQEHNEINLLCECCIVMFAIIEIEPIMCTHLPSVPLFSSWYSHDDITLDVVLVVLLFDLAWWVDLAKWMGTLMIVALLGCLYDLYPSNFNALDNWMNFNFGMWLVLFVITVTCHFCVVTSE